MIEELKSFIQKIDNFDKIKSSEQIDFLAYFLIFEQKQQSFTASQIKKLFSDLRILPYSNIPKYLNDDSNKAKGKKKKFIKLKDGYHFVSTYENEIASKIKTYEVPFINFSINEESLNWKPQDIPFITSKIKKDTVSEAQLIGRGARYFPFNYRSEDKYKRKFDDNENEPLRVIEQMHYHCKHDSRYISEIRQVLIESGIMASDDLFEITLKMKQDFIDGKHKEFQEKNVYVNRIIEKGKINFDDIEFVESEIKEQKITLLPDFSEDDVFEVHLSSGVSQSQSLLGNDLETMVKQETSSIQRKLKDIATTSIIRYAINSNKNFAFDKLKKAYPRLESMSIFMEILGEKKIKITANRKNLSSDDLLLACKEVLSSLDTKVKQEQKQIVVSKHFEPQSTKRFEQKIIRKYTQSEKSETFNYDWYVYENSVLTSEEESFVKWFSDFVPTLTENKWTEIFLVRNEKAVKLFSWFSQNLGEGFEPDFVLLMKKNGIEYVFYIEPKGEYLLDYDKWKEEFLLEIEGIVSEQQTKMADSQSWRLIGLPFYNENKTKQQFIKALKEKIQ